MRLTEMRLQTQSLLRFRQRLIAPGLAWVKEVADQTVGARESRVSQCEVRVEDDRLL